VLIGKVKLKLSVCLTKYQDIKTNLLFNSGPRHEDILEDWMYRSTHSLTLALDRGEG
jgi:hypothetical protein